MDRNFSGASTSPVSPHSWHGSGCPENRELYKAYKELADATPEVEFVGRLATYKYYNMDQVVAQALAVFDRLCGRREPASYAAPRHSASVASATSRSVKNSISLPSRRPQGH